MHKLRVAFYLIPEILYFNGTGDYLDPIIIGEENRISATNDGANVTATITPGEYELHKYCINTSQTNLSSCEWKDASTNITDTLSESGDYYLHVVDKGGYVMHSDKMTYIAYEQLKNYTMLYDEGDECTDITGGWSLGSYTRGGYSTSAAVKNQTNIYANTTSIYSENLQGTNNPINLTSYNKLYIYGLVERATQNLPIGAHLTEVKYFSMSYFYQSANLSFPQIAGYKGFASVDVNSTKSYYLIVGSWDNRGSGYFYNIWLTKPDNWQSICTKAGITTPSDITTLLDDTTSLTTIFSNRDAVEYMAKQCTGDFMASAVSSTTFKTALEVSPYKNIIKDNVHWAKFLAMAS